MKLIIIGAGPGGYTAAFAARRAGLEVLLIDKGPIGGTCLHEGCIPTKTINASCHALGMARRLMEFGIDGICHPEPNLEKIRAREENVINILTNGLAQTARSLGVNFMIGEAELVSNQEVIIRSAENESRQKGDAIIIATGSRITELPGLPYDHDFICDSNDALRLERLPRRLLVVGGGVMGCEMACIYKILGSDVTIIEAEGEILPQPGLDGALRELLAREFRKLGIGVETGKIVAKADASTKQAFIADASKPGSKPEAIETDMILVTVGRGPATAGLGLEKANVELTEKGWIRVNANLQTSSPNIYAIGDALGPSHMMLAHVASAEGLAAIDSICGTPRPIDYKIVPSAIFTTPELGIAGMSEAEARAAGHEIICGEYQMRALGKAQAMGELPGLFKFVADRATGLILGAFVAGSHASDLIGEGGLILSRKLTLQDVAACIHAHPTLSEGWLEASLSGLSRLKAASA